MPQKRPPRRGEDPEPKKQVIFSLTYKGEEYSSPNPVPDELVCPICQDLLGEPQQTTHCGHIFCRKCLVALVQGNQSQTVSQMKTGTLHKQPVTCPTCRTSCDGWFEDKNVNRKVRNVEVFCSNPSCEWKGSLCQLEDHKSGRGFEGCQYEPVSCTLGCGVKVVREYLDNHKRNTCVLRPKNCEYCLWLVTYKSINTHYTECQKYPIPCPNNCGKKNVPIQDVERHLQECPEQEIKCSYSDLGCKSIFKRRTSENYYESSKDAHIHLLKSRVSLLTQAFVEMRRQGPSNVASASSRIDPLSLANRSWLENTKLFPSMPWIIRMDEFSKKKAQHGVRWTSDPFFTSPTGFKLCLLVYADEDRQGSKDQVSVYTTLLRGPNDDILSWPFDKNIKITLLNQLKDRYHHSVVTNFKLATLESTQLKQGSGSAAKGWGHPKFIPHCNLSKSLFRNCQYLKDDCLFFKIKLE